MRAHVLAAIAGVAIVSAVTGLDSQAPARKKLPRPAPVVLSKLSPIDPPAEVQRT